MLKYQNTKELNASQNAPGLVHCSTNYGNKKTINLEISPDSEKFYKCIDELNKYIQEKNTDEKELLRIFIFFSDISKKNKYQIRILDNRDLVTKMRDLILNPLSYPDTSGEAIKILINISKSQNSQYKLVFETCFNFNCLFELLLINQNSILTNGLLQIFFYLTKSKEILDGIKKYHVSRDISDSEFSLKLKEQTKILSRIDLKTMTRTFSEKILDDLVSSNKKILLEILENLYSYDSSFITKEAIGPLVRCIGSKSNEVVINALKILLFFTKDKNFHADLLKANLIFRLVRSYKQGIDEMDVVIVKILYDLFDNKALYEGLFENNVLLILSNYLKNFEVEKNDKHEEVVKNVFEIFKLIDKNCEEEKNSNLQNPLLDDENLQELLFKKAYSLAAFSKSESSILSCLSLLYIMLFKFSSSLLRKDESVKNIIELVPPFFKNKNMEIIKYSLKIFEIILNKKSSYFQDVYIQSPNQSFSIKSLVLSVINLVNEFFSNNEILSMSCRILVTLSDIPKLQPHFLQEPQITVLKIFNYNLLKKLRELKDEKKRVQDIIANSKNDTKQTDKQNDNIKFVNLKNFDEEKKINIKAEDISNDDLKNYSKTPNKNLLSSKNMLIANKKLNTKKLKLANNITDLKKGQICGRKSSGHMSNNNNLLKNASTNSMINNNNINENEVYLEKIESQIPYIIYLLKDSFTVISNLSKNVDNLEVLTLKGFLDLITEKLNDNDTETLPYITRCIQGFCQGQNSIDVILRMRIINKILTIYKLYRVEDEKNKKITNDSTQDTPKVEGPNSNNNLTNINNNNKNNSNINNKKISIWAPTAKRLEVLKGLKNILECDIKLQRSFILEKGIEILLNDVANNSNKINVNEAVSDQLNEMILRVIYVVSCNINKLFLIYFNFEEKNKNMGNDSCFNSSNEDSIDSEDSAKNAKKYVLGNMDSESKNSENSSKNDIDNKNVSGLTKSICKKITMYEDQQIDLQTKEKLFYIFKEQLSESLFMNKLTEVGGYDINSLNTYKELVKIFINLYLNRYYLKYFTEDQNFDKVINIINKIMKKYKENTSNENNYEILKLVIIFLKFICEDENLIKKFLKEDVITSVINAIVENEFYENLKEEEIEQFYYNFSLVLLRLTEFNGHIEKLKSIPDFFKTLEKLYDINSVNGKIYIISIIRNIIAEKQDFFDEIDLSRFLNKVVSQKNSLMIYEFVELIKNLVHSRTMCKKMENVFRYLLSEIKSTAYSADFKKKMFDLILYLSYENTNIKDYSLPDLLTSAKISKIDINMKTTLLLLMNFSSLSNNFAFLMQDYKEETNNKDNKNIKLTKKDFIQVVNQSIDGDRFSQILIQRLLINITSIDGIDMSIISNKILKVLLEILIKSPTLQDNIIIFSLATLVNITNRNVLRFEELNKENNITEKIKNSNEDSEIDINGYVDDIENNAIIDDEEEIKNDDKECKGNKKSILKKRSTNEIKNNKKINFNENNINNKNNNKNSNNNIDQQNILINDENKENINIDENKPLPESDKEVVIVDYILEKIPNFVKIIEGLLNKNSMDISSLTIMFCCNLLRKIKLSKYADIGPELIKCIEDFLIKQNLTKSKDNAQSLLKTDGGKFLLISLIKYFVCLIVEENENIFFNEEQKSNIPIIIMNALKENVAGIGKLKQLKLELNDIKENTVNFALVENQLTFFNLVLLLIKKKNNNYYFSYSSTVEIKKFIGIFFDEFIKKFAELVQNYKNDELEEVRKINLINKENQNEEVKRASLNNNNIKKDETKNTKNNSSNKLRLSNNSFNSFKTRSQKLISNDKDNEINEEGIILKNQTTQIILASCLKIFIEFMVEIDPMNINNNPSNAKNNIQENNEIKNKSSGCKREINFDFYNKIYLHFESLLKSILNEPIEMLNEELKNLFIYILYLIFSNILEYREFEQGNASLIRSKNNPRTNKSGITAKYKLKTSFEEDINLQKWLMRVFVNNKKSLQNDFFCLKIFTISIYGEKFPEIFYQNQKFIKKLLHFFKYEGDNTKKKVLKLECERILNIISFNPKSHCILYAVGVYDVFKSNLFVKMSNFKKKNYNSNKLGIVSTENNECTKEDFILLINMILNKNNVEFIKEDISRITIYIFHSKDLTNNLRAELFDIFINLCLNICNEKQFKEDYVKIFNLLYESLKDSFPEMIFLLDKFTNSYQNFVKKFLFDNQIIIRIFYDFLKYDKNFPSKSEELTCFLKILELYLEFGEITEEFEKMFQDFMTHVTNEKAKQNLRDINILHSVVNFSFSFFVKYCETQKLSKINELNFNKESDDELDSEKRKKINEDGDESEEDSDSSPNASLKKNKNMEKIIQEKNEQKAKKIKDFIIKNKYSELINNIIFNTFNYNDMKGMLVLSMLIIQDDYKLMLPPLKELGNKLFTKEFMLSLFQKFVGVSIIDIKEFVFAIHLAIVISNVDENDGIDCIDEIVNRIIINEIYGNNLKKYLNKKFVNNNTNNNEKDGSTNLNNTNNDDNKHDENNISGANYFNDTITSIYFLCDLVKTNELSIDGLTNMLNFLSHIIFDIKNLNNDQKEILVRYYQEILLGYKIYNRENLDNQIKFLKKVHKDSVINFIEQLIFGTILVNTNKELLVNNIEKFLKLTTLTCLNDELFIDKIDKMMYNNFYKFCKQICVVMNQNEDQNEDEEEVNNEDFKTKKHIAFETMENYVAATKKRNIKFFEEDEELTKKYSKLAAIIRSGENS